jgi:hypothetical protein
MVISVKFVASVPLSKTGLEWSPEIAVICHWLQEFNKFLNEHSWRTEVLLDCCMPTWLEKPALALPVIRGDMAKGGAFLMDREHDRMRREREEAERDVISRVPEDKKGETIFHPNLGKDEKDDPDRLGGRLSSMRTY